jgi:hypothetical protein
MEIEHLSPQCMIGALPDKIRQVCNRIKGRGVVLTREVGLVGWFGVIGNTGLRNLLIPKSM